MNDIFLNGIDLEKDTPLDILNWYRNLYYAESRNTERGLVAEAINEVLNDYKCLENMLKVFVGDLLEEKGEK